ncbi:MAG: hypothetical protein FJY36_05700, partial [Betaproteobacteria bacterium]|nr:hypothetical protein [Betaproteobacteria bacterium]
MRGMSSDNRAMRRAPFNIASLLHGVSRSFGLSIRLLPGPLRAPVGLAYLLARTTDTIADTTSQPAARRLALLGSLLRALDEPQEQPQLALALHDFSRHVDDPHERALLAQGQACLSALSQQ